MMLNDKKCQLVSVLILAAICSIAWPGEPNDNTVRLSFEISPRSLGPLGKYRGAGPPSWRRLDEYKPGHAAGVTSEGSGGRFFAHPGQASAGEFIRFTFDRGGLSTAQKSFLQATGGLLDAQRDGGPVPQWYDPQDEPNRPRSLLLYAVTLEDAEEMALAYYQYAMSGFQRQVDSLEELIRTTTQKIEGAEKRVLEIERLSKATQESLAELQKAVPYRTDKEAHEATGELDKMLSAAQVEIAGIRARIAAIQEYQDQMRQGIPAEISRLRMMFIEESIALQGAEARQRMATLLREQANRFIDLKSILANAGIEKESLGEDLQGYRMNLKVAAEQLESARQEEPAIPAKVTIYPVKWREPEQDN
jgi:hypothetical protein